MSLVAHWKMNDSAASVGVVDSVAAHNGTSQRNTNLLATSRIGKALSFNGSDHLTTGYAGVLAPLSISAWVKTTAGGDNTVISWGGWSANFLCFGINSGKVRCYIPVTSGPFPVSVNNWNDGIWHHVVLTIDISRNWVIYVDGTPDGSGTMDMEPLTLGDLVNIGALHGGSYQFFNGMATDLRIYNVAISSGVVASLYNLGQGTKSEVGSLGTNLVAHWAMDDDAASTTVRESVGGNNGTSQRNTNLMSAGKVNSALEFNGTSDCVDLPVDPAVNTFTFSFWTRPLTGIYQAYMVDTYPGGNGHGYADGDSRGFIIYSYYGSAYLSIGVGGGGAASASPLVLDSWNHIVIVRNGSAVSVWLNGAVTATITAVADAGWSGIRLGCFGGSAHGSWSKAAYDDVRLYNVALTPFQVAQLYNSGHGTESVNINGPLCFDGNGIVAT